MSPLIPSIAGASVRSNSSVESVLELVVALPVASQSPPAWVGPLASAHSHRRPHGRRHVLVLAEVRQLHARCRAPGRNVSVTLGLSLPSISLQQGRRRRRGLRLSDGRGLGLGLELTPELEGRHQGGPQGGENDF